MPNKKPESKKFYGKGLAKVSLRGMKGHFITIDGALSSGCSTQAKLLRETFERAGYPSTEVSMGSSELIGKELQEVLKTSFLSPYTLSLFDATEIADHLENKIIPALKAGFVVIADRYIFSIMIRGRVRKIPALWLTDLFGIALQPDLSIILDVKSETLAQRCFAKAGSLGFWESGRDCIASSDIYEGFIKYQDESGKIIKNLTKQYGLKSFDADEDPEKVHSRILRQVKLHFPKLR